MPTEIDAYIEHVISLSKDYNILFDKYMNLVERCKDLEDRVFFLEERRTASPVLQVSFVREVLRDVNGGGVSDLFKKLFPGINEVVAILKYYLL